MNGYSVEWSEVKHCETLTHMPCRATEKLGYTLMIIQRQQTIQNLICLLWWAHVLAWAALSSELREKLGYFNTKLFRYLQEGV